METCEVDAWSGYQGNQAGNEIQWFENEKSRLPLVDTAEARGEQSYADRLRAAVDGAAERTAITMEAGDFDLAAHSEAVTEARILKYQAALADERDRGIMSYRQGMNLDLKTAEVRCEEQDRPATEAALRKIHGLPELRP